MLDSNPPSSCVHPTNHSGPNVNLGNDILWYIFSLNANMDLHFEQPEDTVPALLTLRYTSQVCSSWRELAIGSPSLWSRIIDVNLLSQTGAKWRNEVIRRTGTALLDVKASNCISSWPLAFDSLEWLLKAHWSRIRSLVLGLDDLDFYTDEERWIRLFERPAPSLEIFKFLGRDRPEFVTAPSFVLFSNTAPALRTLYAAHMRLNFNAFRTPNLCHLVIHSPVSTLDLLNALSQLHVLESLETWGPQPFIPAQDAQDPLPLATLPQLTQIKFESIFDCADLSLSVLAHIMPAKGCILNFLATYQEETPGASTSTILSTYLTHYIAFKPITNIELTLYGDFILLEASKASSKAFSFGLNNKSDMGEFSKHIVSILLSAFSTAGLTTTRTLTLNFSAKEAHSQKFTDILGFIRRLVSVEELKCNFSTLNFLHDVLLSPEAVVLPKLKAMYLKRINGLYPLSKVADLIKGRIGLGVPPETLIIEVDRSASVEVETLRNACAAVGVNVEVIITT
ncbi:hypothetical protein GALMADRAFT_133817 [Galerina marginata CBS 339.88]|uniref:Uncharacterized protein n=1 Tax=Galerina marginata (strain CBS 339.88) TaxID=685588 RepID=A0A067TZQ2_GALM3|nr:hypothetical protein GALMADRAFT_133817 [Galerina marginata CBS 339.88]